METMGDGPVEPGASGDSVEKTVALPAGDAAPSASPSVRGVHRSFAGHEILGELGRGGMGAVYKARQPGLNRLVAVKLLLAGRHASETAQRRFLREARAMARLRHPHIVTVHDVGEEDGQPYFVMEYVDGLPLDEFLGRIPMDSDAVIADLAARMAEAVHCAHGEGIIHRDLKPSNILMDATGMPHITDFGLAKDLGGDSLQSMDGDLLGTPAYMAPEQAAGRVDQVDVRTDVYALGAILYTMLTRDLPFEGQSLMETITKVLSQDPEPVGTKNPSVAGELGAICQKAMEKDPALRYPSAQALAEDLRRFVDGQETLARPQGRARRMARRLRRRAWGWSAVAAALLLGLGAGLTLWRLGHRDLLDLVRDQVASPERTVRLAAATALRREVVEPASLPSARRPEALAILYALHQDPDPDVQGVLLEFLRDHGQEPWARDAVGPEILDWLIATAGDDGDPALRNLALDAMGGVRHPRLVDFLLAGLHDPSDAVRRRMVRSLGRQRSPRAIQPLMELIQRDPVTRPDAQAAVRELTERGRIGILPGPDAQARQAVAGLATALAGRQDGLDQALEGPDRAAARRQAFHRQREELASGDEARIRRAIDDLARSGEAEGAFLILERIAAMPPRLRTRAAEVAGRLAGDAEVETLTGLLRDPEPFRRAAAARILAHTGRPDAAEAIELAFPTEASRAVRDDFAAALEQLGFPSSRPILEAWAQDAAP